MMLTTSESHVVSLQSQIFPAETEFLPHDLPGVENVITRQFFGSSDHFLPTDDTDIVGSLQIFRSSIRIPEHENDRQNEEKLEHVLYRLVLFVVSARQYPDNVHIGQSFSIMEH